PASGEPVDVGRSGDAALDVGRLPEPADRHQAGEAVRHLDFGQAVRVRVEPVQPARMVRRDHVAVPDVAILQSYGAGSGIERARISLAPGAMCVRGLAAA